MLCDAGRTENDSKEQAKKGKKGKGKAAPAPEPEDKSKEKADTDPDGEEMMRAADPLGEARKYLTTLQSYCAERIATHMAACEVSRRLGARTAFRLHTTQRSRALTELLCACLQRNRCSCSRRSTGPSRSMKATRSITSSSRSLPTDVSPPLRAQFGRRPPATATATDRAWLSLALGS